VAFAVAGCHGRTGGLSGSVCYRRYTYLSTIAATRTTSFFLFVAWLCAGFWDISSPPFPTAGSIHLCICCLPSHLSIQSTLNHLLYDEDGTCAHWCHGLAAWCLPFHPSTCTFPAFRLLPGPAAPPPLPACPAGLAWTTDHGGRCVLEPSSDVPWGGSFACISGRNWGAMLTAPVVLFLYYSSIHCAPALALSSILRWCSVTCQRTGLDDLGTVSLSHNGFAGVLRLLRAAAAWRARPSW